MVSMSARVKKRATSVSAEGAERERRSAAEIFGLDEAAGHQDVAPHPRAGEHADVDYASRGDVDGLPLRSRLVSRLGFFGFFKSCCC